MKLLLSCDHVAELLSEYHEGNLPWALRARVKVHLLRCEGCHALSATLLQVPALVRRALELDLPPDEALAQGRSALAAVLPRLGTGSRSHAPEALIPEVFRDIPAEVQDAPLRVLTLAHRLFGLEPGHSESWFLPQAVLDLLPPRDTWTWEHRGPLKVAELLREGGARLCLIQAPSGFRIPVHEHQGSESLLVLAGGMSDDEGSHDPGAWVHHGDGSSHSPVMSEEGCLCLVREEGGQRFMGPLGWLRNLMAA